MKRYFLADPEFGHDLKKITEDANKRLPKIWWYDIEGDLRKAEENFLMQIEKKGAKVQENLRQTKKKLEVAMYIELRRIDNVYRSTFVLERVFFQFYT
jgi:hypothetical protein